MNAALSIIATECKSACAGEPDLEKRIRKAMAPVANGHWMIAHDDDLCFRGALGGVLLAPETTEDEKERITKTLGGLRAVAALLSGVPVDVEAMAAEMEREPKVLPLMDWWRDEKKKGTK